MTSATSPDTDRVDFFQRLTDQAASLGVEDYENTDLALHPAVEEYLRWRQGEPLLYGSLGEMPAETALGFQHLVRTLGKEGQTSAAAIHDMIAESSRTQAELQHRMLMGH